MILHGLQGVQLDQEQLIIIQQRVMQQVREQQSRQQGKAPPNTVTIQLTGYIGQEEGSNDPN